METLSLILSNVSLQASLSMHLGFFSPQYSVSVRMIHRDEDGLGGSYEESSCALQPLIGLPRVVARWPHSRKTGLVRFFSRSQAVLG